MTDIDFSVEQADPEYMRLIYALNDTIENNADDTEAFADLYAYGAWVETINGTEYFRHPSRKAAQS